MKNTHASNPYIQIDSPRKSRKSLEIVKRTGLNDNRVDRWVGSVPMTTWVSFERYKPCRWCFSTLRNFMNELPATPYMECSQSPSSNSWHHRIDVRSRVTGIKVYLDPWFLDNYRLQQTGTKFRFQEIFEYLSSFNTRDFIRWTEDDTIVGGTSEFWEAFNRNISCLIRRFVSVRRGLHGNL